MDVYGGAPKIVFKVALVHWCNKLVYGRYIKLVIGLEKQLTQFSAVANH